jgi:hypothetical protein
MVKNGGKPNFILPTESGSLCVIWTGGVETDSLSTTNPFSDFVSFYFILMCKDQTMTTFSDTRWMAA